MTRYRYHPEARTELRGATHFYPERSKSAARAFREDFALALEGIRRFPEIGALQPDGFRKYVLKVFPYSIHYSYIERIITITAVAHHSRKPGYWKDLA